MDAKDDGPGLYYGAVLVSHALHIHCECVHGWCQSNAEFVGLMVKLALEKYPNGRIINTAGYRIQSAVIRNAAALIKESK